jgi:hypothetical protein
MSSRTYLLSIRSLEPIRKAIGSKDRALFDAFVAGKNKDFQAAAKEIIMKAPPANEPGWWQYFVEPLAEHLGLSPRPLPLDDWKQHYVWRDYRAVADAFVSAQGKQLLEFLEAGRPFVGSGIEHDGCMFAWLTAAEVKSLLAELTAIDAAKFSAAPAQAGRRKSSKNPKLEAALAAEKGRFHQELIQALQATADANAELFLGAN